MGLFGGKAVLVIDGGAPRTLAVGQSVGRVRLIEVGKDAATVDINGHRAQISLGEPVSVGATSGTLRQVTLVSDARGHFFTSGMINGSSVRFLVDTGATSVAMDRATATRAGIVLSEGTMGMANTANGTVTTVKVKIAKILIGDITLFDVDATVLPVAMPEVLLGMSFLNRMEMRREGSTMVLTQRY
ncbi:MAG: family clan aspartic protease [Proteobacteria bacterium]|nr:family clan aspartic protease [Pseudomonadota bacterium]